VTASDLTLLALGTLLAIWLIARDTTSF